VLPAFSGLAARSVERGVRNGVRSSRRMRPCGPEPRTRARSTPSLRARSRTDGAAGGATTGPAELRPVPLIWRVGGVRGRAGDVSPASDDEVAAGDDARSGV